MKKLQLKAGSSLGDGECMAIQSDQLVLPNIQLGLKIQVKCSNNDHCFLPNQCYCNKYKMIDSGVSCVTTPGLWLWEERTLLFEGWIYCCISNY